MLPQISDKNYHYTNLHLQCIDLFSVSLGIESVDIDSDDNTLFAFSFDGGTTWKAYTDGRWVVLSEETSGMNRESIKTIGTDAWNDAVTDRQYKIRFALRKGGFVNRITVHYLN